ncbi:prepilin-type N-terminal cleavage/methylation domain-containing protein [Cylindrospermum stagnale PCC 7417]|uniref:Prepilin-type N-terminal cleavage/methylation domain-containing protein n=1 Tax=Cylindrospermum stagnale PCC 7417 TaxID=56107 RepID=K9X4R4_9NOST|nr:hormogonium polysaccharide secretion pseudopilin HpsC [Cylindrospermum stagnale]AFZ27660.1 prepilin-type N-terminal cleavage/methylation domain-containing protein [Cylindrospermum stagnale PCC 7417]
MKNILGFLLRSQIQCSKQAQSPNGFTLIELLVGMVMAVLVITPLLGFMIDIMNTENREQAKSSSEQEIQAALDYIAQDVEQAVYIYDADGMHGATITNIDGTSTTIDGIIGQIPNTDGGNRFPVLAFWKRNFLARSQTVTLSNGTEPTVGCLVRLPTTSNCNDQDYQVYSLVVYYLIKEPATTTWNNTTTRIARWEIRDGIRDASGTETRFEGTPPAAVKYLLLPNPNFKSFDLASAGDLRRKLGNWKNFSNSVSSYNLNVNKLNTLVDFIDQTPNTAGSPAPVACNTAAGEQQVPDYNSIGFPNTFKTGSFYACVDAKKYIARVYIRGNSLARIQPGATYNSGKAAYFPTATIQIKGRGFLGVE